MILSKSTRSGCILEGLFCTFDSSLCVICDILVDVNSLICILKTQHHQHNTIQEDPVAIEGAAECDFVGEIH